MGNAGVEKRRFRRAEGKSLVQFRGDSFVIYSNLTNVGEGGVFVHTCYMLDKGDTVDLEFDLPNIHRTIGARGRVVAHFDDESKREESFGLGIEFSDIREEDRSAIKDYIDKYGFVR